MDRRSALKRGGLAALGLALGGCGGRAPQTGPRRPPINLAVVEAAWDRVIRTTVGLRPHRPSGFQLRVERLDDKTVIHNYGHGGAGHSLGWGTGALAADLALEHESRRVAVIGCGTVGLTAARQLQRRGFDVTIFAKSVPPDTTSNMALAGFTPTSGLIDGNRRTAQWDAQFRRAAEISYAQLQLLAGRGYGVSWINSFRFSSQPPPPPEPTRSGARPEAASAAGGSGGTVTAAGLSSPEAGSSLADRPQQPAPLRPPDTQVGSIGLGPGEHPFPAPYARRSPWLRIEPAIYLDRLVRDVIDFGGRIVIRELADRSDLMTLGASLIVNCTGLGARELFNDDELTPLKGQLTMLVPQPDIDYGTFGGIPGRARGGFYHMIPRSDGLALGGTSQEGEWSLEPDEEARRRVVETHIELFAGMRPPDPSAPRVSSARRRETPGWTADDPAGPDADDPRSSAPPLESFFGIES